MCGPGTLSCEAKLARVVLDNRGPLSPDEVAEEARLSREAAAAALEELAAADLAESVCGLCESKETVYELVQDVDVNTP
jgi:DNA-binding transcriptional regulator GbsR (MarR family)